MTVENNGPLPGSGAQRVPLSPQRRGVLHQLRGRTAPVTAAALAKVCALHVNTVREHLDALVDDGLAARERSAPAGRGRPAWRYRARPPQGAPAREYAGLAAVLAARIARASADPRGDALAAGEDWGRVLTTGQTPSADPKEARRRLLDLLSEIGFAPEADEDARRVRLPRCPFAETAREHPGVVCGVHEGLARAALAALGEQRQEVELLPFAESDACRLHLSTPAAAGAADPAADTAPDTASVSGAAGPAAGIASVSGAVGPAADTAPITGAAGPAADTVLDTGASGPAADTASVSGAVGPAADIASVSGAADPAADTASVSGAADPAADTVLDTGASGPAADTASVSGAVGPAADTASVSGAAGPAADTASVSGAAGPAADTASVSGAAGPAPDTALDTGAAGPTHPRPSGGSR